MRGIIKHHRRVNVGERIRGLRKRHGLTGVQLAARAGIDQSYLSKLERGRAGYSPDVLARVIAELGVTLAAFYGSDNVEKIAVANSIRVPVLNYVQAGLPRELAVNLDPDKVLGHVAVDAPESKQDDIFGLVIKGESMQPEFRDGDCVIMQRSLAPQPGDCVVAVTGEGEATFKRYRVLRTDPEGRTVFALVPNNDDFPTLRSDEHPLKVRATMIEHRKYRRR